MKKLSLFLIWIGLISQLHAIEVDTIAPVKMTPLVGAGCVINQIDKDLVEVIAATSDLGYIVDTNPNNYASFKSVVGATVAYNPSIAVKDMHHVYEAGVNTGFVIQSTNGSGTNLLTANVLQMFWIEIYLNGVKQETSKDTESTGGTLLNLNLLTVASNGQTKVAVQTTKPFNEIRISVSGITADVLSNLKIYYAYVGENPVHPITKTEYYTTAEVHASSVPGIGNEWTTAIWNWPAAKNSLVGENSESEGVGFGLLSDLLTEPRVTINANQIIPAGSEVGFIIETGTLLAINLLQNAVLSTYDANNNQIDSKTIISVLGLTALGGGKTSVSMITTAPCTQVKIKFGGLNINVSGTKIFYAYVRSTELELPTVCDLKLSSDITLCSETQAQLTGVNGITWSIEEQPTEGTATVNSTGLVSNINKPGVYVVKAVKGDCVDYVRITRSPESQVSNECNQPIVGANIVPFTPKGGGCLLCLATGTDGDVNNVIDTDLDNYVNYTQGFDLASNTSVFGVRNESSPYKATPQNHRRVGFVMQATNQFLTADLLKFFVIKTYLKGEEQESSLVNTNNAVSANLIAGSGNKMRYSFEATKGFDAVALWTAGLLNINISKFRIYYAFQEPANSTCYNGNMSDACAEILSSDAFGAEVAYNHTGFNGVANIGACMLNIGNLTDSDINTSMQIVKVAGVGGSATISVKMKRVVEHGYQAGFIVKDITWVTNVDLLNRVGIKTYLNGVATGDELGTPEVLSLDLIGSSDKAFVSVKPTMPFDEIQLDLTGLTDVAISTDIYGAYMQTDTDNDGIPDCVDQNPCGERLIISNITTGCEGSELSVSLENKKEGTSYTLCYGDSIYLFNNEGIASFMADSAGVFNYVIKSGNDTLFSQVPIIVHPSLTTWTGKNSTDWNDWENWTRGTPYSCTDVIIPNENALNNDNDYHYPILKDLKEQGIFNICNNIHIEHGAEIVRQDLLCYNKAFVDLSMKPNKYYMLSIPLKDTYSGDFYVLPEDSGDSDFYIPVKGDEINRLRPKVYFHEWNSTTNSWIDSSNELAKKYDMGKGFVRNILPNVSTIPDEYLFRFSKTDTVYYLFNNYGTPSLDEPINVAKESFGQLSIDTTTVFPVTVAFNTTNTTGMMFLVGNPFICHLNLAKFVAENSSVINNTIKVFSNNEGDADDFNNNNFSEIVVTSNDTLLTIAPMQAFFVSPKSTDISIKFTQDMMVNGEYPKSSSLAPQTRSALQNGNASQLSVFTLKAYTRGGEGVIESADKVSTLQVFTVAGKLILEKQNVTAPVRIPLAEGVNIIKVQTENETKTFKLIK